MTVFIVFRRDYEDSDIIAVCANRDLAAQRVEEAIFSNRREIQYGFDIEEHEVEGI